jgi:uncharacterized protein YbaA (DUF1428 family)
MNERKNDHHLFVVEVEDEVLERVVTVDYQLAVVAAADEIVIESWSRRTMRSG